MSALASQRASSDRRGHSRAHEMRDSPRSRMLVAQRAVADQDQLRAKVAGSRANASTSTAPVSRRRSGPHR
jgi:hypothetical protein